jgi:hypothetical protein
MDDLIDMMIADQSPADISDKIKEILMQKSAENIDTLRPVVAASMFGTPESGVEQEQSDYEETETEEEEYQEEGE